MCKYKDPTLSVEERASDLLSIMTLEEKIAQITLTRGVKFFENSSKIHTCTVEEDDVFKIDEFREAVGQNGIGYIHDFYSVPAIKNKLQRILVEETRLGIPCIMTAEALHGVEFAGCSIFPVPLTLSQTFDPELIREVGDGIATETRAIGHHEILAPNLDVSRDPRWGRTEETFGEDTYLASEMAVAIISGEQKGDISRNDSVISEPKHFCVHGIAENGINCSPARVGQREVETCYLPVFEAAIKHGGAYDVMVCYNAIDGEVVVTSEHYLKEVLKKRFGLRGISRSDWGGIERIMEVHHLADTVEEAVYLALKNGLDAQGLDVNFKQWQEIVLKLVKEGKLDEKNIDDSVLRILKLKFELGLFDKPYIDEEQHIPVIRCDKHKDIMLRAAEKAIVLLKNDGTLPMKKDFKSIAVIGPSSAAQKIGGYSSVPRGYKIASVYEELQKRFPEAEIHQCDGCAITHTSGESVFYVDGQPHLTQKLDDDIEDMIEEAVEMARRSEIAILVCGDNNVTSGEGRDRADIILHGRQRELILKVSETGTPVVLVLENGKAVDLSEESKVCEAIVVAGFGGEFGAKAIVEVLAGDVNPAGRLSISYPRSVGMLPCYYSQLPRIDHNYLEGPSAALYPFGHGLSYTEFKYSDLKIIPKGGYRFDVSFNVTNNGDMDGDEVVQLYVNDLKSSILTPQKLLRKFKRLTLKKGETQEVCFRLDFDDLKLLGIDWKWKVEPGDFDIMIGSSSEDIRLSQIITVSE